MTFEEGNFYTLNGVVDIARCQSKRIKLLEQRIIDLQGHDDLSHVDRKLSEQEDLKDAVEREWVGLTDDEVEEAFSFPFHYRSFYKAVEAKLKEKNGG
jgi:hypothetical protein